MATVKSKEVDILENAKRSLNVDYVPSDDEEYMSDKQQEYFRNLLLEARRGTAHSRTAMPKPRRPNSLPLYSR